MRGRGRGKQEKKERETMLSKDDERRTKMVSDATRGWAGVTTPCAGSHCRLYLTLLMHRLGQRTKRGGYKSEYFEIIKMIMLHLLKCFPVM